MTILPIDIRRYDVSAKRRFDETTFQENDVASPLASVTCYSKILKHKFGLISDVYV